MNTWRQKQMYSQRTPQNTGSPNIKYTTRRFQNDRRRAANDGANERYSKKEEFDFTHRSNRYRQYTHRYRNESSNSNTFRQTQHRNYEHNRSKVQHNHNTNAKAKANTEYVYCPQPQTSPLREANLRNLAQLNYMMRVKSDGMNMKCYITQNSVYFIDALLNVRMLTDVFYGSHGFVSDNELTLFDGELFVAERNENHSERNLFYRITDCIVFEGELIANQNSSVRYRYIKKFMQIYTAKLMQHAKKKLNSNTKRKKSESEDDFVPGDDVDTAHHRLLSISSLLPGNYQHTKNIKKSVINYCKSIGAKQCDDHKMQTMKERNDDDDNNSLDGIQLDGFSVVFTQATTSKATKTNLKILSQNIKFKHESTNCGYAYYYDDLMTGIKCKSEGIFFIPENNNYLMNRTIASCRLEVQRIWKPVDLLTVDIQILKCNKANSAKKRRRNLINDNSLEEMDNFIDGNALNLYVSDNDSSLLWFNCIDMGENDDNDGITPFWTEWHLKQRSTLHHFVSMLKQENEQLLPFNEFIAECNYDFSKKSWSLYKLKLNAKRPSALAVAQEVISQMEEFIQINDLIDALL